MDELISILEDINPDIDYLTCEDLIDGHRIESLSILSLVSDIEDEFDISIPATEIIPQNFNSAKALMKMIERLSEED